jgi:hypothetical protein
VTVTAPAVSKRRTMSSARLSRTTSGTRKSAPRPIGTLTKKIHSQPAYSVRTPPASTPMAAPEPAMAPRMPRALLRSEPSRNVTETIEKTDGARIAPPRPCSARNAMSMPDEVARPQASEKRANAPRPTMKSQRRPSRSPTRPPRSRKPPKVRE